MNPEALLPLPADPKRQADALFRGCEYQLWQTVNAWLRLGPDERLYVEGAEDFDVVGPNAGVATQVKNAERSVSLRSSDVQDAIRNYWELRNKHLQTKVSLRFLTRGTIAKEQAAYFGESVTGLGLWMRPTITDQECRELADFLVTLDEIGADLKQWLQAANPDQIREELIRGITWETSAEGVEYVERAVRGKLAEKGESCGVPPSVAKQVARRLLDEILKIMRKKTDRFVDRLRFLELWEQETHVSVPLVEYQQMVRAVVAKAPAGHGLAELFQKGAPPFAGVVAQRSSLVDEIYKQMHSSGFLHIHGSTRMGKTTLAKLVVRRQEAQWLWWSAARQPGSDIAPTLRILTRELDAQSGPISVVLDDLDFTPTTVREFEEALGELIATVRSRRGSLLFTGQKKLSVALIHAFGLTADQMIAVPYLNQEEVVEIAEGLGCPEENRDKWTAVVRALTAGHPHLVAVHLLTLQRNNWPAPTTDAVSAVAADVEAEKHESRQLLSSLPLPQRQALYRLSVFPGVFRRDHGIAIISSLPEPGDLFDPLLGPWIEPLHAGYFTLSPLISRCAKQVFSPAEFQSLQIAALRVFYECESRSLIDGSSAFQLAWELRDAFALGQLSLSSGTLNEDSRATLAEYLAWFIFEGHTPGEALLPDNLIASFLLRKYQFDLAIRARPECAMLVYRSWRMEAASRDLSAFERLMISMTVLSHSEVPLPGNEVVQLLGEFAVAKADIPDLATQLPTAPDFSKLSFLSKIDDTVSTLGFFVCWRCKTIKFLDELLDGLGETSAELRTRMLRGFASNEGHLRLAFSRVWMAEAERETPDWSRCVSVFEKAYQLGLTWGFEELALAAISGIAVVQDEYLHDSATAHATINQLASAAGLDSHQIDDRRANIYFGEGKFIEAEMHWHRALSRWPVPTDSIDQSAAFAARSAGVAAAKMEKWDAAAAWFEQVQRWLPEPKDKAFVAGALADAAYAFWKAGKPKEAVTAVIEAWAVAGSLPTQKEDLRAFATQKRVGHVVTWLHAVISADNRQLLEPIVGMCSNPAISERVRELEPTEPAGVWIFLMRMERKCDAGDKAAKLGKAVVEASKSVMLRPLVVEETITRSLHTGDVADLPKKCIEFIIACQHTALVYPNLPNSSVQGLEPEMFHRKHPLVGAPLFLAGVAAAAAAVGTPVATLLTSWRAAVATNPFSKDWNDWFDEIGRSLAAPRSAAMALFWSGTGPIESIFLGVLNILFAQSCTPEDLFAAHARLLRVESASRWFRETGKPICRLVERAWMRAIESPALLCQPRFSIPEIRLACSGAGTGLQKAARILLAARNAVRIRLPPEIRADVERLAQ